MGYSNDLANEIKTDFPLLSDVYRGHPICYLDNAATMQMPLRVIESVKRHYLHDNGNIHRGVHFLSERSTAEYERARNVVAAFVNADPEELIFTSGTTGGIHAVAFMMEHHLHEGDEILMTEMEHHSNLLPWMQIAQRRGCILRFAPVREDGQLDLAAFQTLIGPKTKLLALTQMSNVTGISNPLKEMIRTVRTRSKALILVDGAQGIVHFGADVKKMDCDFYVFSGHKIGALTGIGALYVRRQIQELFGDYWLGGGTVFEVSKENYRTYDTVERLEPGTPNYVGAYSLAEAICYWNAYSRADLSAAENQVIGQIRAAISDIDAVRVVGDASQAQSCLALVPMVGTAFDWAKILSDFGIAVRSGHHCAQPYHTALGCRDSLRISAAPYNTEEDAERLIKGLICAQKLLKGEGNASTRGRRRHRS